MKLSSGLAAALLAGVATMVTAIPTQAHDSQTIWNGFYGGFHVGYAQDSSSASIQGRDAFSQGLITAGIFPSSMNIQADGVLLGGQVGYNHRHGQFVWGVELDASYAKLTGSQTRSVTLGAELLAVTVDREINWLSTLRGRVGMLATPSLLLYATGGLAVGETNLHAEFIDSLPGLTTSGARTGSKVSVGWTAGGGFEQALNNWASMRVEYLYVDLGTQTVAPVQINAASYNVSISNTSNVLRAVMNFKF